MIVIKLLADITTIKSGVVSTLVRETLLIPTKEYYALIQEEEQDYEKELEKNFADTILVNSIGLLETLEVHNMIGSFHKDCLMKIVEVARISPSTIYRENWVLFGFDAEDLHDKEKQLYNIDGVRILGSRRLLHYRH